VRKTVPIETIEAVEAALKKSMRLEQIARLVGCSLGTAKRIAARKHAHQRPRQLPPNSIWQVADRAASGEKPTATAPCA
jgi:hypothetical protein